MYLETGRDLFRGTMILQSVITDWCPVDLILRPLGLKKKLESRR
jgi:hypothetical protein